MPAGRWKTLEDRQKARRTFVCYYSCSAGTSKTAIDFSLGDKFFQLSRRDASYCVIFSRALHVYDVFILFFRLLFSPF
jgi:hypothetical protein